MKFFKNNKPVDIKKSGPQSYRDLQKQNAAMASGKSIFDNMQPVYQVLPSSSQIYYGKEKSPILKSGVDYLGRSRYDDIELTPENWSAEAINQGRYDNQPWYDNIANGVAKMLGKTGTTFLDSVVGLPLGLIETGAAAVEGQKNPWSKIWDNEVSKGMENVNDWMEDTFKNYKSTEQQNSPWYSPTNLLSTSSIADNFIDNAGFILGSVAASMTGVGAIGTLGKILNLTGKIGKVGKGTASALSALFSASGEAMTEAQSGVQERNEAELIRLGNSFLPEMDKLKAAQKAIDAEYQANKGKYLVKGNDGKSYDPALLKYRRDTNEIQKQWDEINKKYEAGKQQIEESGLRMGNKIFGLNQVLLTAGNLIQFGKAMGKGFRNAMHEAEEAAKITKPWGVGAKLMDDGTYKIYNNKLMRGVNATKGLFTEGLEEMNQQTIQNYGGISENEVDVNDYWKAKLDPKAYRKTTKDFYTLGNEISKAFAGSYGDVNQWEQFVVGGITGLLGSYAPTKIFNQDKSKSKWNPLRYGEWSGGAINEVKEYKNTYNKYKESIDDLNTLKKSKDFHEHLSRLVAHTKLEDDKTRSAENNDKKAWKDADDKQTVHDIQTFARAGKIDDLRDIYNSIGGYLSDDDINSIINTTTRHITAEQDKQRFSAEANSKIESIQIENYNLSNQLQNIFNTFNHLSPKERSAYYNTQRNTIDNINKKLEQNKESINALKQSINDYEGKEYSNGPYVDNEGNTKTSDEVREELNNNSKSLNKKLDDYLKSFAAIREATGGTLTKDQEDNLAYLHFIGGEKLERSQKIANNARKDLPKTLLIKSDKTPEQLAKEYNTTDLAFSKDKDTKDGYVKVDVSKLSDAKFVDFFVNTICNGSNIIKDFLDNEEEDEKIKKEEEGLSDKEKQQRKIDRAKKNGVFDKANEQLDANSESIYNSFIDNYRNNNPRATELDESIAVDNFLTSLKDMVSLYNEAGEYGATLRMYMAHPELVDEKKEEAVKTAAKEVQQEAVTDKVKGKDVHQVSEALQNGSMDDMDLDSLIEAANETDEDENDDEDTKKEKEETKKAAEVAKIAKQKHDKAVKLKKHADEIINELPDNKADEDMKASLRNSMYSAIDTAEVRAASVDEMTIDTTEIPFEEAEKMSQKKYAEMQKLQEEVSAAAFTRYNKDELGKEDIPSADEVNKADKAVKDSVAKAKTTGHDPVTKTKLPQIDYGKTHSEKDDKDNDTGGKSDKEVVNGSTIIDNDAEVRKEITSLNLQGESSIENSNWRTTTRRNPYHKTTGTYHEQLDKNSREYRRSKAIYEYLKEQGAWDRVDNTDPNGRIKEGDQVHIMVKFLPEVYGENVPFNNIPDKDKPYSLVLIMLDSKGNVLGDLPLAQLERFYDDSLPIRSKSLKNLIAFQKEAFEAFEKNYTKTGNDEAILDDFKKEGVDSLNIKKINDNSPTLSIKNIYRGSIPLSEEYNTCNEIAGDGPLMLGIISNNGVITGIIKEKIKRLTIGEQVRIPQVISGRPMMLLDSPSGVKTAVPIVTDPFTANKNSLIYRILKKAIVEALASNKTDENSRKFFRQLTDLLQGLLQVERYKNDPNLGLFKRSNNLNTLTVNLHRLGKEEESLSFDIDDIQNYTHEELADRILGDLASKNIPIQISASYINNNIEFLYRDNGEVKSTSISYNKIIGELAKSPVDKNTKGLVNNWFTLDYAENSRSTTEPKLAPKASNKVTIQKDGASYTLDFDSHTIKNKRGDMVKDEYLYKEYARAFAENARQKSEDVVYVVINNENLYYDKKNDEFVPKPGTEKEEHNTVVETDKEIRDKDNKDKTDEKAAKKDNTAKEKQSTPSKKLTIQEIEKKVSSFLDESTIKVWNQIPDSSKVKLANGEVSLQLSSKGKDSEIINSITSKEFTKILSSFVGARKLKVTEITKNVKPLTKETKSLERENERKARHWLSKNLPSLNTEERTQFVEKLTRGTSSMWATYKAGVIEILKKAPRGTTYHEAFHYVMDVLLSPEEKEEILTLAGKEYGLTDKWEIEERLANDFRRYVIDSEDTGIVGTIKKWLRKIMDRINRYNRISDDTVNQLFWKINNGQFAKLSTAIEEEKENREVVLREIRNVQNKRYQWDNLNNTIRENIKESGLSKEAYDNMSLEEKEQYVKCRG